MVDGRVVERPCGSHRSFKLNLAYLVARLWLKWRPGGGLGGKWRPWVKKVGEWFMESRHLQGCSPRLCRLRINGLAPASKYWTYRSHASITCLVSWCSCVTTWLKPLSPTPKLSWGRYYEVTQGDGRASLSLVTKTFSGCRGIFHPYED
jgi:hypothetical protein